MGQPTLCDSDNICWMNSVPMSWGPSSPIFAASWTASRWPLANVCRGAACVCRDDGSWLVAGAHGTRFLAPSEMAGYKRAAVGAQWGYSEALPPKCFRRWVCRAGPISDGSACTTCGAMYKGPLLG